MMQTVGEKLVLTSECEDLIEGIEALGCSHNSLSLMEGEGIASFDFVLKNFPLKVNRLLYFH